MDMQTKAHCQKDESCSARSVSGTRAFHLHQTTVNDLDQVICNPYALEEDQEKGPNGCGSSNTVHLQLQLLDRHKPGKQTRQLLKCQMKLSSKVFSKPAWMKRASTCPSKNFDPDKPFGRFPKRMASKTTLSSTPSQSQTNLLVSEGAVMDSFINRTCYHLSVKKLGDALRDTVLPDRGFLDESSQWMEPAEAFLQNDYDYEKKGYKEKLHPDHMSTLPRDKYLSRMHNAVQLLSQSEQNNAHTRSGYNVFRALLRRTNQELRFLHFGQSDPEQEALVREEYTIGSECLG